MSSEWVSTTLGAVTEWMSGGTPKKDEPSFWGGDIPWISANSMHGTKYADSDLKLTNAGLINGSRLAPKESVLLLVRGGALHNRIPVGITTRPVAFNQDVKALIAKKSLIRPLYLLYWLMGNERFLLDSVVEFTGIGAGKLDTRRMQSLEMSLPAIDEQDAVVSVVMAIDDRITLLRETNATLEAIAQALFKSWFVDFDPVRAKAEGRARQDGERSGQPRMPQASDLPRPGAEAGAEAQGQPEAMDATTAALFPDSFEETELGLVPKGWEVLPLRQLCAFQKGCSYKGDGLADGEGAYMFNLGCFNEPRVYAFQKVKRYVGDYKPKHQVYPGDLIIANTDMTQQRDILGRPLLVPSGMEPGFISHHVFKVEVGGEFGNQIKNFLFFSFQQAVFRERAVGYATGTTVLALPRDALEEHCVVLPSQSLLMAFSDVVSPLLAAIHENEERATLLTQLRDTLLPRLISGQLRLPEAEATVEEVL